MTMIYQHRARTGLGETAFQMVSFREKAYISPHLKEVKTLIKIETPGAGCFEGPMTEDHKIRYAKEYAAYLQNKENCVVGLPLEESSAFEQEVIELLAKDNIVTLEQLADAPDSYCKTKEMRKWRERAQTLLDTKKRAQMVDELEAEVKALKEEVEELRRQNRMLNETLGSSPEALGSATRGRKKVVKSLEE